MSNADHAISFVLRHEGGYVNDPNDAGGETKYGISLRAFPWVNIPKLTEAQARSIYREHYWHKMFCHSLPYPVALALLDFGVNSGVSRAAKYLQWVVGVERDGYIGPKTIAAVHRRDPMQVARGLIAKRIQYLARLEQWRFLDGWVNRCTDLAFEVAKHGRPEGIQ